MRRMRDSGAISVIRDPEMTVSVSCDTLGTVYHRQAKRSEALNCYGRALSLDASNSVARENLMKLNRVV